MIPLNPVTLAKDLQASTISGQMVHGFFVDPWLRTYHRQNASGR
jgi:hypothetical protein